MLKNKPAILLTICLITGLSGHGQWWSPVGDGIDHDIRSFTIDSVNDILYAGGDIDSAGGAPASHVVKWDGIDWTPIGMGFNDHVDVVRMFNGELWAGGDFTIAPGNVPVNCVAKWNGTTWSDPGGGMDSFVFAMVDYGGFLYAGGIFNNASGNPATGIARWNGTSWQSVGGGLNGIVYSLAVYNGELYAGGHFTVSNGAPGDFIAKWNGTSWSSVGTGMNHRVYALRVHNGELYAGGSFMLADGNNAQRIAKWNGTSWAQVGAGFQGVPSLVSALEVYNGDLYAGGIFEYSGAVPLNNISRWDGATWSDPAGGVTGVTPHVKALITFRGELYTGGEFELAGSVAVDNVAKFNALPPLANFFTNDTAFCANQCINFFDISESSPQNWAWSFTGASPSTSSLQHPENICYSSPGTYPVKLVVTNSFGTDSLTFTSMITVYPQPDATITPGDTSLCEGDQIILSAQSMPGANYTWSNNGTIISGQQGNTLTVSSDGNYSLVVSSQDGCTDSSIVSEIIFHPLPVMPVISQNFDTLFAGSQGGIYQWYLNGAILPGATSNIYITAQNGTYTVTLTSPEGCEISSDPFQFTGSGFLSEAGTIVNLFPNPANEFINVVLNGPQSENFTISDLTGRSLINGIFEADRNVIETGNLPAGMYIITIPGMSLNIKFQVLR